MWKENPALYEVAKQVCHENGLPWTDPRTGVIHQPPKNLKMKEGRRTNDATTGNRRITPRKL